MLRGIIKTAVAPLMSAPDEKSERVDEALHGMVVDVLNDCGNGWLEIITGYAYKGFIRESSVHLDNDAVIAWDHREKHFINHYSADVLSIPKVQGVVLLNLTMGCFVVKASNEEYDGFVKIILPGGTCGYVRNKFLHEPINDCAYKNEAEFRKAVVDTAAFFMNTQYRWGGKSPRGIDCSGLCFMAYFLNGVTIFRDASINSGFPVKEIPLMSIKPGDLIYFPNHIAMYIGSGKIIHSSIANDGVHINSINDGNEDYNPKLAHSIKCAGSIF